jgi:hypothetical protein
MPTPLRCVGIAQLCVSCIAAGTPFGVPKLLLARRSALRPPGLTAVIPPAWGKVRANHVRRDAWPVETLPVD